MTFPLLGLLIRIGGGAAAGARLYIGVVAVLIGLSTYFLARGVTRRRSTALVAEALVVLNPSLLQMFFWGAYPNLLGFVFLNLSLGFLVRYIRSRRPLHLIAFWASAAGALLTHSLVGTVEIATVGLVLLLAVSIRAVPREIYRSRSGVAGIALFGAVVGGFYLITDLLGVHHPNYFQSGAFAYVKNGLGAMFYLLLRPFFPGIGVPLREALPILFILVGLLGAYAIGLRLFWRRRMTLGTIVTLGLSLAVTGLALLGWELSIVTDYVRFGYFLVVPLGLGLALFLDWFMTGIGRRAAAEAATRAPTPPVDRPALGRPWRLADPPAAVGVLVVAVLIVLVVADLVTAPALPKYETNNTKLGHDSSFLDALSIVRHSGVQGSLLTVPGAAKWTRSLLVRDAYAPNLPARYTFDATHLVDEETAYFALTSRYAVTNGQVAVATLGTNLSDGSTTFEFEAAYFGTWIPIASLPVGNLSVDLHARGLNRTENVTSVTGVLLGPPGQPWFEIDFAGRDFTLTVLANAASGAPTASFLLTATARPGATLLELSGNLSGPSPGFTEYGGNPAAGSLNLTPGQFGRSLQTNGQLTPANALESVTRYNRLGTPAHATFHVAAPAGGNVTLSLRADLATPGAANLVSGLPDQLWTSDLWQSWLVRFVLYTNATENGASYADLLPNEVQYLETEYGGKVIGISGRWTVVLLPPANALPGVAPVAAGAA